MANSKYSKNVADFNYEDSAPKESTSHKLKKKYWSDTWLGNVVGGVGDFLSSPGFKKGAFIAIVAGGIAIPMYNKYFGNNKTLVEEYKKIFKEDEVNVHAKYLLDRADKAPLEVQEKIKKNILEIGDNKNVILKNEQGETAIAPENFSLSIKNTDELNTKLNMHLEEFERNQGRKDNVTSPASANKVK